MYKISFYQTHLTEGQWSYSKQRILWKCLQTPRIFPSHHIRGHSLSFGQRLPMANASQGFSEMAVGL